MIGNVLVAPEAALNSVPVASIAIGDEVRVGFKDLTDDVSLPVWIPVNAEGLGA
jgi:hypothetical protein